MYVMRKFDKRIIYFFSEAETSQTTLPSGENIYRFASDQIEFHHNDKFSGNNKLLDIIRESDNKN